MSPARAQRGAPSRLDALYGMALVRNDVFDALGVILRQPLAHHGHEFFLYRDGAHGLVFIFAARVDKDIAVIIVYQENMVPAQREQFRLPYAQTLGPAKQDGPAHMRRGNCINGVRLLWGRRPELLV